MTLFLAFVELVISFAGAVGWASLILLPGAWITFGLSLKGLTFWMRMLTGVVLSPLVVCIQFYLLRLAGASFELTIPFLVAINLPVSVLFWKRREEIILPGRRTVFAGLAVLLVAVICLMPQLLNSQTRAFTGHAWMHADIIYMLANGELVPDDPELAGVRLAYPWAGHVFQAGLSYLTDSAPVSSYIWTNLVWLLCIYGLVAYIVAEFGGDLFSQITSFIWLCLGLNLAGYIFQETLPQTITQKLWIGGDYRYSPWVLKFYFFEQIIFGLGMFSSLLYLLIKDRVNVLKGSYLTLILFLLCGIGIVYPILLVPSGMIVGARTLAPLLLDKTRFTDSGLLRTSTGIGTVLLIASSVTFAYLRFLSDDRVSEAIRLPELSAASAKYILLKTQGSIVALALMLGAFFIVFRRCWRDRRNATFVLAVGASGSLLLNILLEIPFWGNEYKFLFTASICLSPFPALALEPLASRLKNRAIPLFAVITLVLAAPFAHKINKDFPWRKVYKDSPNIPVPYPLVDADSFDLRLADQERMSALCDNIREKTTTDTLLVIEKTELHFPTLTRRRLYSPPDQEELRPGINLSSMDLLAGVRGYDKQLLENRRTAVEALFNPNDDDLRQQSLEQILQLGHPLAVILERQRHTALEKWLAANGRNINLFDDGDTAVWIVKPREGSSEIRSER
jgi:hypothetical protein